MPDQATFISLQDDDIDVGTEYRMYHWSGVAKVDQESHLACHVGVVWPPGILEKQI
jgi:hypothetical protein